MRNLGTNNYSNNFEPQVNGVLDARTKIEGPASNLLLTDTWRSSDGNVWLPVGIRVSIVDDPDTTKNGVYMLLKKDYTKQENWLQLGANSSSDAFVVDALKLNIGTILDNYYRGIENLSTTNQIEELLNIVTAYQAGRPVVYADDTNMDSTLRYGVLNITLADDSYPITITTYNSNGDLIALSIDSFTAPEPWTVKFLTGNILVISNYDLIDPDRTNNLLVESAVTDVIYEYSKRLTNGVECFIVYRNNTSLGKILIIPLTVSLSSDKLNGTISYVIDGNTYNINISRTSVADKFLASPAIPQVTYLETLGLLDNQANEFALEQKDITALSKLFSIGNSNYTQLVYRGVDGSGNQYLVPLNIYTDFGLSDELTVYDISFIHPYYKSVHHFSIGQKEDGTIYAFKVTERGVYVSSLTLGKLNSIATEDIASTSDQMEVRKIWKLSNKGYTIMLSGGEDSYNKSFIGATGPLQVFAEGGTYDAPSEIAFAYQIDTYMNIFGINFNSKKWFNSSYNISVLFGKNSITYTSQGTVDISLKEITFTISNLANGLGLYYFDGQFKLNGYTYFVNTVLNIINSSSTFKTASFTCASPDTTNAMFVVGNIRYNANYIRLSMQVAPTINSLEATINGVLTKI